MTRKHAETLRNNYHVHTEVSEHKLGLIEGVSPESTETYYHLINRAISARLGAPHSAHIIGESFNFAEIDALMRLGESGWQEISTQMDRAVRTFKSAGARAVAVCSNTMHRAVAPVCQNLGMPLIHIGDVVARVMQQNGAVRVGLLGTSETMNGRFLIEHLSQFGTEIVVPDQKYHSEIDRIIFEELCAGVCQDKSRNFLTDMIQMMRQNYKIDGVILGCTEIPLLITPEVQTEFRTWRCADRSFMFYDSTKLHSQAITEFCCTGLLPQDQPTTE